MEPSAPATREGVRWDWRGQSLPLALETARDEARAALGQALRLGQPPATGAAEAWAAAELAVFTCLDRAIEATYKRLRVGRPPTGVVADLLDRDRALGGHVVRALNAPDPRTRYAFLEDLLAAL